MIAERYVRSISHRILKLSHFLRLHTFFRNLISYRSFEALDISNMHTLFYYSSTKGSIVNNCTVKRKITQSMLILLINIAVHFTVHDINTYFFNSFLILMLHNAFNYLLSSLTNFIKIHANRYIILCCSSSNSFYHLTFLHCVCGNVNLLLYRSAAY